MPTPPKISLPMIIPNAVPMNTCHKGTSGGIVKGINAHVTRNPSFTSCLRIIAKESSPLSGDDTAVDVSSDSPQASAAGEDDSREMSEWEKKLEKLG